MTTSPSCGAGSRAEARPATSLGLPAVRPTQTKSRPGDSALIDQFGRVAKDLRVSLTDRCNLRCTYCMPAQGLEWMPGDELLTVDELQRLISIAVRALGVQEIRFTGGEPLLHRDLVDLVSFAAGLSPRPELSITTNGRGLSRKAEVLAHAGLDRINVSLDSIDPRAYAAITRRDRLDDVLDGLRAARSAGLTPIKINAVLQRGVNDFQAADLLEYCLGEGYELRFIEQMPLDAEHSWDRTAMVTADEIMDRLSERFRLSPDPLRRGAAPAQRWQVDGGPATVGIIASVTRPFCGDCDRVRLTADGRIRNCLFAAEETDLRSALRAGSSGDQIADDAHIAEMWRDAMWKKQPGHGIDDTGFLQPARPMSAIGG